MVMFAEGFHDDVINRSDGGSTAGFLLNTRPTYFRSPASVLVKSPFTNLYYQIPSLRQTELWL